MYKIIWVSAGHGYRSEQNLSYPTRAEADAECKRLNDMWVGTITHWAVEDTETEPREEKTQ